VDLLNIALQANGERYLQWVVRVDSPSKRNQLSARAMPKNAAHTHRQVHAVLGSFFPLYVITGEKHKRLFYAESGLI
jgi:hypothetical protein